jgi:uncharacterized membrane protein YqjE
MSDDSESQSSRGPVESARNILESVVGLLSKRFELATLELEEEKHRAIDQLLRVVLVAVFGLLSLMMLSFLIIVVCWDTAARLYVISGWVITYALAAWRVYLSLRRKLENGPTPFSATVDELRKDVEWFRKKS